MFSPTPFDFAVNGAVIHRKNAANNDRLHNLTQLPEKIQITETFYFFY